MANWGRTCPGVCRTLRPGHVHLLPCQSSSSTHQHHGVQHMGPLADGHSALDEVTHGKYCEAIGWADWCSKDGGQQAHDMDLCPAICAHAAHEGGKCGVAHCLLPLWHDALGPGDAPPQHLDGQPLTFSQDGHLFLCRHPPPPGAPLQPLHLFFLIDDTTHHHRQQHQDPQHMPLLLLPWLQPLRHQLTPTTALGLQVGATRGRPSLSSLALLD